MRAAGFTINIRKPAFLSMVIRARSSSREECVDGFTPLGVAVMAGYLKIADFLLKKGASIYCDVKNYNRSLLFSPIIYGESERKKWYALVVSARRRP